MASTTIGQQFSERCDATVAGSSPTRVHIIGGPGCGKTQLASRLASQMSIASHTLDDIETKWGTGRDFRPLYPAAERRADAQHIARGSSWVSEGTYLWWTEDLLRTADLVIWLDFPLGISIQRILLRHAREYLGEVARQRTPEALFRTMRYPHVRNLVNFLHWTWRYYRRSPPAADPPADIDDLLTLTRVGTARHLQRYAGKLIRCSSGAEIEALLVTLALAGQTDRIAGATNGT